MSINSLDWMPGSGTPPPGSPADWDGNCDVLAVAIHRAFGLPIVAEFELGLDEAGRTELGFLHHAWAVLPDGRMLDAHGIGEPRPEGDRPFRDSDDDWVTGLRVVAIEQNDPHLVDIRETSSDFPYDQEVSSSEGVEWAIQAFGEVLREQYGILPLNADAFLEAWSPKNGPEPMLESMAAICQEKMRKFDLAEGKPDYTIETARLAPGVDVVSCAYALPHTDSAPDGFLPWFGFLVLESNGHTLAIDSAMTGLAAEQHSTVARLRGEYPEADKEVVLRPGDRVVLHSSTVHWMRPGHPIDNQSPEAMASAPRFSAISFEFENRPTRQEVEAEVERALAAMQQVIPEQSEGMAPSMR